MQPNYLIGNRLSRCQGVSRGFPRQEALQRAPEGVVAGEASPAPRSAALPGKRLDSPGSGAGTRYRWRLRGWSLKRSDAGEGDDRRHDVVLFRPESLLELLALGALEGQAQRDAEEGARRSRRGGHAALSSMLRVLRGFHAPPAMASTETRPHPGQE